MTHGRGRGADTSPAADAFQIEAYRRMGGSGRVQVMLRLSALARGVAMAGIRARHRDYDEGQVLRAWARLAHGDEVVRQAWPDQPLVEP